MSWFVDELFDRLPPLAALTGWERDRLKWEAERVLEPLIDPSEDLDGILTGGANDTVD